MRHPLSHLARVRVLFTDGNAVWTEHGRLDRATLGPYGGPKRDGFVLYSNEGGTRIFPLTQRQATVYLWDGPDEPVIQTSDNTVLLDKWSPS